MTEFIDDIVKYLGILLLIINFILFTKSHKYYKNFMAFNILYIYIIISLTLLTITNIFNEFKIRNLYLSHFYFIFQFIILSIFYITLLRHKSQQKLIQILFVSVIFILGIQYALDYHKFFKFSLLEIFLTSFPLTIYSTIHLYNSLTTRGEYLYFNAAILIYITATTLIFILGNYITGEEIDKTIARNIWFIHKVLYLVFLILTFLEWKNSFSSYKTKA